MEEFRIQRDDLMKKFENQETSMEEQEKRHKREVYETERKYIIKKDQLKKDMEAKLLQLSTEFQDATELRIAATTHRVIRENISINNELDILLSTQQRLYEENNSLKKKDSFFRQQIELLEGEKKKALGKVKVQLKVIERLTDDHKFMTDQVKRYKRFEQEVYQTRNEMKEISNNNKQLEYKVKILEQNLHQVRSNRASLQTDMIYLKDENERLTEILVEGVQCIKDTMCVGSGSDISVTSAKRDSLLATLFTLLSTAKDDKIRRPSLETIDSVEKTYARGDLGFVPKVVELRSSAPIRKNTECQTATSFERFLQDETLRTGRKSVRSYDEEESDMEDYGADIHVSVPSLVFFDESEMIPEEQSEASRDFDIFAVEEDEDQLTQTTEVESQVEQKRSVEIGEVKDAEKEVKEGEGEELPPQDENP